MRFNVLVLIYSALLVPTVGFAEVSDKITLIPEQWFRALLLGAALFAFGYFRWKIARYSLVLPCLLVLATYQLQQSDIGPHIVREQGMVYFTSMYTADTVVIAMAILGVWLGFRRHRRASSSDAE